MRAITIQQPYAHLIVTPQEELPEGAIMKRVENRVWSTEIRGTIAIHAGISRVWFKYGDWPGYIHVKGTRFRPPEEMVFGAIVGTVDLVEVFHINEICGVDLPDEWAWLIDHDHTNGPYCFVLDNVKRFEKPIPCKGQLGFWNVPEDVVEVMCDR